MSVVSKLVGHCRTLTMRLLVCFAVVGVLGVTAVPAQPTGRGVITVYGVVDKVIDGQLQTFRDNYQSELVKQLNVEPHLADKLIHNLGFDEYRSRLNHIGVKNILDHPVIVLMRSNPADPTLLSVYMVKEGIGRLADNPLSMPILDALRTGDNVPIVFSPAMLPNENILAGLHLDNSVAIVSKTLDISNFARLAISFSDIPWLLVQPRNLVVDVAEGLQEIGVIEVVGDVVKLHHDMSPNVDVSELRTADVIMKKVPVRSGSVGTTRDSVSFLNWPALNLPALSDVPAIVLNFPLNIIQSILDYLRARPPVSVTPIVNFPTVKPATEPTVEGRKPEEKPGEGQPEKPQDKPEKPEHKPEHQGNKDTPDRKPEEKMMSAKEVDAVKAPVSL